VSRMPHPDDVMTFRRSFNRRAALAVSAGFAAMSGAVWSGHGQAAAQDATPTTGASGTDPVARSVPRVFADDDFQFQFLFTLGQAYERAADVGECFAAAAAIRDGDYDSWFDTFFALAERIRGEAETADAAGRVVSAQEAYLRAATYYGPAYFFADGTKDPSRLVPTWEAHRAAFDAFAARLDPPAEPVQIPYEGTTLPGYALTVDTSGQPRPWLIMNNGSDGTVSDMWSEGAAAALRRGYNSLIFDGPGQGAALFRQGLAFRPDWEKVITPVVDWLLARADVDPARIAILGISQGGYWVPRAVAFEHRIAAAIADPGVVDVAPTFARFVPPDAVQALLNATGEEQKQIAAELDEEVAAEVAKDPALAFALAFRLRPYGTTSYAEVLILTNEYNSRGVVGQIRCPMLIANPEGEQFWPGQSQELYDLLPGPKTLVHFTAAEGADLHCEPKALGLRAERFFNWLDDQLRAGGALGTATP
jgi:dienelactone hydrolase